MLFMGYVINAVWYILYIVYLLGSTLIRFGTLLGPVSVLRSVHGPSGDVARRTNDRRTRRSIAAARGCSPTVRGAARHLCTSGGAFPPEVDEGDGSLLRDTIEWVRKNRKLPERPSFLACNLQPPEVAAFRPPLLCSVFFLPHVLPLTYVNGSICYRYCA